MFEKKVTKNQEMRIKYPDNPEKYVECCLGLYVDINVNTLYRLLYTSLKRESVIASTGLLIFCAVAERQNSGKSPKSRKVTKTLKMPQNLVEILSNTCLYSICETYPSY